MMKIILETERLIIREFIFDDSDFVIRLVNSPGWLTFIGDRNIKNTEQARQYMVQGPMASYKKNGFGFYVVLLKATQQQLGICGLIKRDTLLHTDLGFAFLPEFNGRGYAYEASSAIIHYSKNHIKLKKLIAIVMPENASSIKLLEKLGMTFDKMIEFGEKKENLMLYQIEL